MIKVGGHKIGEVRQGNDLYTAIYLGAEKIYSVANIFTVTTTLTNVTSNAPASVQDGGSLTVTLTPASGMSIDTVMVLMGGTDITATAYSNGVVSIASVTENVSITASASVSGYENFLTSDGKQFTTSDSNTFLVKEA